MHRLPKVKVIGDKRIVERLLLTVLQKMSSQVIIRKFGDFQMKIEELQEGVTDNSSTLVVNTSENEKKNKAEVAFLFTIVDKKPILLTLIIGGLVYSHGPTPLLWISKDWMQVLFAGSVISNISSIILAGSTSYFKEIQSPDHPGFVVCSMIVFWELLFSLLLICIILLGFERSSKCVIWSVGFFLLLSLVVVWVAFQRQPMIVWLKWTKKALEWMLKWAKNAFEGTKAKISEWM